MQHLKTWKQKVNSKETKPEQDQETKTEKKTEEVEATKDMHIEVPLPVHHGGKS